MPRLRLDLERARREGWQFGAKLVRGQPQPWSAANLIRHMSCDPTITPCTRAATLCTQAATPCMPPGAWGVHGARARARSGAGVRLTLSPSPHSHSSLIVRLSLNRYEDPIQPTAEATHANYREALQLLLRPPRRSECPPYTRHKLDSCTSSGRAWRLWTTGTPRSGPSMHAYEHAYVVPRPDATWLMVATHNEASIAHAAGALLNGAATVPPRQALGTVTANPPPQPPFTWPCSA